MKDTIGNEIYSYIPCDCGLSAGCEKCRQQPLNSYKQKKEFDPIEAIKSIKRAEDVIEKLKYYISHIQSLIDETEKEAYMRGKKKGLDIEWEKGNIFWSKKVEEVKKQAQSEMREEIVREIEKVLNYPNGTMPDWYFVVKNILITINKIK